MNGAAVIGPAGPVAALTTAPLAHAFAVNAAAPLRLMGALLAGAAGRPLRVVNVSSGAAHRAYAGWSAYCATKAALRMAGQVLRHSWCDRAAVPARGRPELQEDGPGRAVDLVAGGGLGLVAVGGLGGHGRFLELRTVLRRSVRGAATA